MAQSRSLIPQKSDGAIAASISAFESEVAVVAQRTTPRRQHAVLHVMGLIILAAFALSAVLPLDEVVESVGGQITTMDGPLYVQPLQTAIVHQIMVKVGDVVKKGQVLATLDPTFATADVNQLQDHLASDQAMIDRLEAEQQSRPYQPKGDGKYEKLQLTQWQQRQQEYKQSVAGFDAQIANAEALLRQAQSDVKQYTTRARLNNEIATAQRTLANNGNAARLVADQAEDTYTEIARLLGDAQQNIDAQTATIANVTAQKAVYVETWMDYIATNLVTTRNDYDQTVQSLTKAQKVNELTSLVSPEDGIVLQIAAASGGSIVNTTIPNPTSSQQQPLFTLTPLHGPPLAQLNIDSGDIAFIRVGDPVILNVEAFPFVRFGNAEGVVSTISDGSFTQLDNGSIVPTYFKVWVNITKLNFHNVPANIRLVPGMTLDGNINVGKRTAFSYLYEALMRNATEAMREP